MTERQVYTDPKQVIVIRRDLEMPAGKLAAQVAHASMACIFSLGHWSSIESEGFSSPAKKFAIHLYDDSAADQSVLQWMTGSFGKITLEVYSEEQMNTLWAFVDQTDLPRAKIVDSGRTVFSEPTLTCFGLGPADRDVINELTGSLKLYGTAVLKEDGYYHGRKKLS